MALAILALFVLATQLGAVGTELIDPDEATFILMGEDVARGNLLYVGQFDLKPPVIFLLIGATIALFGESLAAIRLMGDLLLLAAAVLVFLAGRRLASPLAALGGAVILVALSASDFGLHTASELPPMAAMAGAYLLLATRSMTWQRAAAAGALIALAVLTRTNLAIVALAIGILLLAATRLRWAEVGAWAWLAYGLGGVGVVLAIALPYALAGELEIFWLANVLVPLSYSGQGSLLETVVSHGTMLFWTVRLNPLLWLPAGLLMASGALGAVMHWQRDKLRWPLLLLIVFSGAVLISLMIGGVAYPHYWLQLFPFAALFATLGIELLGRKRAGAVVGALLVTLAMGAALVEQLPASARVASQPAGYDREFTIRAAASHILSRSQGGPEIWAWQKHLVHWYADAPLLSKAATHPDNLAREPIIDALTEHGYVEGGEIERLFSMRPDFVVTDRAGRGAQWLADAGHCPREWLARHYTLDAQFGDVLVYRRSDRAAVSPASSPAAPRSSAARARSPDRMRSPPLR